VKLPYPPYYVTIEATNRCNYKCIFCPQSDPKHCFERSQGDLTVEGFKEFIRQVKQLNSGNDKISICLDGEPLLNKEFPEFIKITNEEKIIPRFSTNGRFLSKELIDTLTDFGKFIESIDFASRKEYFEGPRGKEGDFQLILENIEYAIEEAKRNNNISI
jgi:MoaA/NifB/PqqE/SkfB family radical SAM enzyme